MELNRKSHPDCAYASNPYHECASACLERIAQGHGKKHTKNQAPRLPSLSGSFGKNKKESESPYAARPYQNNTFAHNNSPKDHRPIPPPDAVKKKTVQEEKTKKTFSSSSSSEEIQEDQYSRDDSLKHKQEPQSQTVLLSPNDQVVDSSKGTKPTTPGIQERVEKNGEDLKIRSFSFLNPPRSNEIEEVSADEDDGDDDDDDNENNGIVGEEIELESVMSESCVSVGKYRVRSAASATLRSIIDKHGDIAENCKLESASMKARYLECLCSLVQELRSTPVSELTKLKVREMLAVLRDLDSVSIGVGWLRSVLEEFSQFQNADAEKERQEGLVRSAKQALEDQEGHLARMEKEVAEARSRVDEARARAAELEKERLRLEEMGLKAEKFKGESFLEVL